MVGGVRAVNSLFRDHSSVASLKDAADHPVRYGYRHLSKALASEPFLDAFVHASVAFSARHDVAPFVFFARQPGTGVACVDLGVRQALPRSEIEVDQQR